MTGAPYEDLRDLSNLHAIADALGLNLSLHGKRRELTGLGSRSLPLAIGLALPAVVSYTSAAVLVSVCGDLGLLVISREKGMVAAVVDLSKLRDRGTELFWTEPTFTRNPLWSARLAQEAVEPATVAVFERTPPSAPWTRIS